MKRNLSLDSTTVVVATLSQASVPGAEEACTAIAIVACAAHLTASSKSTMELWIHQGGALHSVWRATQPPNGPAYALANEILALVAPAWPIEGGAEHGGAMTEHELAVAIRLVPPSGAAILTCGAASMAIFCTDSSSAFVLFDSHMQPEHNNCATSTTFETSDELVAHLMQRFGQVPLFSFTQVCRCLPRALSPDQWHPKQALALAHADSLPPAFLYVWPCDTGKDGGKAYLVAGLEDFFAHYERLLPRQRHYYDLARAGFPVRLYMDLEYKRYDQNPANAEPLLDALLEVVKAQYAAENGGNAERLTFFVTNSSKTSDDDDDDDMSISGDEGESNDHDDEVLSEPVANGKVSYHVTGSVWFSSVDTLRSFMQRVEQRVRNNQELSNVLLVWQYQWDAQQKTHMMKQALFADMSVYTRNRCFRLPYSSKFGEDRPFLPLNASDTDALFETLLSPPAVELYTLKDDQDELLTTTTNRPMGASVLSSATVLSLTDAPSAIQAVAAMVEAHFRPTQMRGYQMTPTGLITFPMVKHDCGICQDRHSNQVYAVADMKSHVFWEKCHADRLKKGPDVPFPTLAADATLSLIDATEMQPGAVASVGLFPAESTAALLVLSFAGAIFESASSRRSAPPLPAPGTVAVHYDCMEQHYEVTLPGVCPADGGIRVLKVTMNKLAIRCKGKHCSGKGKRWERPSRSATLGSVHQWNLSFLFPRASLQMASVQHAPGQFPPLVCNGSAQGFLDEPNLLLALGTPLSGAPRSIYKERLDQVLLWCTLKQREAGNTVDQLDMRVRTKMDVISRIVLDTMMEPVYRECLAVAADFAYPIELVPKSPITLASALWIHLARKHGYKRVEQDFYVPETDAAGRSFYRAIPIDQLPTSVCSFDVTPNLCSAVMWNGRVGDDLRRLLMDQNHFPSTPICKRYLGYANVVYDLERNESLDWDTVRADRTILPFNFLDQPFPVDLLARAKQECPEVLVTNVPEVQFSHHRLDFVPTPLFDGPLHDQAFPPAVIFWLYALLGRLFYYVGKDGSGDNWEAMTFLLGAPGSFKSSIVSIVSRYFQPSQVGILGTRVESQFPLDDIVGKLVAVMTECSGCTLDRDLLKLIASGDPVRIAGKYKTALNVPVWLIPLLFAGNAYLSVRDTDGSLERRSVVFAFLRMLRAGQGSTDLADRIFQEEGPALLIKWNTIYLQMRGAIRQRIHDLLPASVRNTTRQAMLVGDSFKAFFAQELVVTGDRLDRLSWNDLWSSYCSWCQQRRREQYTVDPTGVEAQAMLRSLGVRLSHSQTPLRLVHVRRRTENDAAFENLLEVRHVHREGDVDSSSDGSDEE